MLCAANTTKRKGDCSRAAFHGSTIAAASMCGLELCHREFGLPLSGFLHTLPLALSGMLGDEDEAACVERLASNWKNMILREGPDSDRRFYRPNHLCWGWKTHCATEKLLLGDWRGAQEKY